MYRIPRLISINARAKYLREKKKLLILGSCVETEHPEILQMFEDFVKVSVCLEEEHMNMVGLKLGAVLARNNFEEVGVLTTDGSPHCVQLHFMVEETFKIMGLPEKMRKHYVIEKNELWEIPPEVVKTARYLSKIRRLYKETP